MVQGHGRVASLRSPNLAVTELDPVCVLAEPHL